MVSLFYISGMISLLSTVGVILCHNPMYSLLCLIVSFVSMSCIFFSLGAYFAGAIEIIIYAGAVMILFTFVIMMLNIEDIIYSINKEHNFLNFKSCFGVLLLISALCTIILCELLEIKDYFVCVSTLIIDLHQIGYKLFGFYMLVVEMASFLLLGALVSVLHISQEYKHIDNISNR